MYQKILCPVDGSPASNRGMKEAINIAKSLNAKLRFIHVIDTYYPIIDEAGNYVLLDTIKSLRKNAEKVIKKAKATAESAGVIAESKLSETLGGRASAFIVEEANTWQADLIVMGTRGIKGFSRLVMGSDAEHVVRTSNVPVMLTNNAKKKS